MVKRSILAALLAVFLITLTPTFTFAQAVYGSIIGTVTDPQGAAIPNAKVTVTSATKGTSVEVASNADGNYTVIHLIPDTYNVRIEAGGFKSFEAKDIRVFADQGARLDAPLAVGGATETVTVEAGVPLVKTDRADVATTFTERQVTDLPVIGRNFTNFQLLTPGTQTLTWQHASSENPQQSTQINVNGQHFSGTSFQLDGTDNRDPILGIIVINPNLEAVTETKISTQNYDAEFGQALAAVITAQTKSGSNDFHGSAFLFRRNDEVQARDPFTQFKPDPVTGKFIPDALSDQFGGGIGGPIVKNKLFFFGDYQGTRQKVGQSAILNVPTTTIFNTCLNPSSLICDLSDYTTGYPTLVYDPATGNQTDGTGRTLFNDPNCAAAGKAPGTCIDNSRLSPQALALLNLLPQPNLGTGTNPVNNYAASGTGGYDSNGFDTRIDYNATDKLHFLGRYSYTSYLLTGKGAFDTASIAVGGRGLGLNNFAGRSESRDQSLATGFDYTFSSTWLTDFRFGYFRYRVNVLPNGFGSQPMNSLTTPGGASVQAPGLNLDDNFTSSMPGFFIADRSDDRRFDFGYALDDRHNRCNCPLQQQEDQFQFVNNWTNIRGNHQFKFGADIRYARNLRVPSDAHRSGELHFDQNVTSNVASGGGLGLASFLLGDVSNMQRYVSTATDAGERQKRWFFYGQDTFRVTPKLTLNYGLRWEIYFPQTVTGANKGGFVDLNTGLVRVAGVGPINDAMNVDNTFTNFAPRLGVAYQVTPKTVVRMGYGRSFDIGVFGSIFGHSVTQNLPVLTRQDVRNNNSFLTAFTLAAGPPTQVFPTPDPTTGTFLLPPGNNQFVQTNKMRLPTVDAWNVTVQREITSNMSAEIAYVGNKGTHVFAGNGPDYNCNQASVVGFPAVPQANRRPFFGPFGWTQDMRCHLNNADDKYNALQTKIEKRFSKGYSFLAHYTYSKASNYDGDYFGIDRKVNYGPNDFNRNHVFVLTNIWELPIGRGRWIGGNVSSLADKFIGGWQINAVTNWSGGLPFSPSYNLCGNDRDTGPCRPNKVGSFETGAGSFDPVNHVVQFFQPVAGLANNGDSNGAWQRPQVGEFGNAGRNSLRGPRFFNTDLSLFKNITFGERVTGTFEFRAFNVFNKVNLGTPGVFFSAFGGGGGNCIDCSSGGQITSLGGPMRQLEFGAKIKF